MKRKALGRGLGALIQSSDSAREKEDKKEPGTFTRSTPFSIEISKVRPNPGQPRKTFKPETLQELAQSIKKHGLAQPILVIPYEKAGEYMLVAGERRLRAAQLAGLKKIDAVVRTDLTRDQRLALALIENIQREDLNPIEEALAYLRLMREMKLSQSQLSEYTGKSKPKISNTLRLLDLEEKIQSALSEGTISEGHGRALLALEPGAARLQLFERIVEEGLSVRAVESAAKDFLTTDKEGIVKSSQPRSKSERPAELSALENELQVALGTKVKISASPKGDKGTMLIHFYSPEDLDRIASTIKSGG